MALRALVTSGKGAGDAWDLKLAPGAQLDVEFLAQYIVLRHAPTYPALLGFEHDRNAPARRWPSGCSRRKMVSRWSRHRASYTSVTQIMRLAIEGRFDPGEAGGGLKRRLVSVTGLPDFATLERSIAETRRAVRDIFDMTFEGPLAHKL